MNDNPYPNASDTMHYELHTAWDEGYAEGFAAGRAAATPDQPGELVSRARYAAHLAAATPGPREDAVTTIVRVLNRTMDLTARERAVAVLASIPAGLSGKTSDEKTGNEPEPHESERIAELAAREAEPNPYRSQDQIVRDEERTRIVKVLRERATSPRSKDHGWSALEEAADFIERGDTDA